MKIALSQLKAISEILLRTIGKNYKSGLTLQFVTDLFTRFTICFLPSLANVWPTYHVCIIMDALLPCPLNGMHPRFIIFIQ